MSGEAREEWKEAGAEEEAVAAWPRDTPVCAG